MPTYFIKNLKKRPSVESHTLEDTVQKDTLLSLHQGERAALNLTGYQLYSSFLGRPGMVQDYNPSHQG